MPRHGRSIRSPNSRTCCFESRRNVDSHHHHHYYCRCNNKTVFLVVRRSERGGAKFRRRTEFRWWAWRVINISGGKRRLDRSKKLNEWHHLAKVVPSRLAGVCKIVSGDITSSYPLYLGYPTTNWCFQYSRGTTLALEEKQRFLSSRGVGGKERKGKGKERVRREDVERRKRRRRSDHNFAAQSCYCGERGGKRSFCHGRS